MTTLSVIVPAHNVERYVGDLLISLTRNTRSDFEFVFVNDGSTDRTPEILEAYRDRLPGFTLVQHATAQGLSSARNAGLRVASGRFITYVDGDDWLAPGYLSQLVAAIEGLGSDYVKTDHVQAYGARRVMQRAPQGRRGVVLKPRDSILPIHDSTMVDYPNACTGIYRRTLADDGLLSFDPELLTCEDRPWTWRLVRHAASYAVVSLAGVFYRRDVPGSLTQIGDQRQLHYFDAFDKVLAELDSDPDRDRFIPKAMRTYCDLIVFHQKKQQRLTPELRKAQRQRAQAVLRGFDPEALAVVLPGVTAERSRILNDLLGRKAAR